jgi:hypothetical protein
MEDGGVETESERELRRGSLGGRESGGRAEFSRSGTRREESRRINSTRIIRNQGRNEWLRPEGRSD